MYLPYEFKGSNIITIIISWNALYMQWVRRISQFNLLQNQKNTKKEVIALGFGMAFALLRDVLYGNVKKLRWNRRHFFWPFCWIRRPAYFYFKKDFPCVTTEQKSVCNNINNKNKVSLKWLIKKARTKLITINKILLWNVWWLIIYR